MFSKLRAIFGLNKKREILEKDKAKVFANAMPTLEKCLTLTPPLPN